MPQPLHLLQDRLRHRRRLVVLPVERHELPVRVHQVHDDRMIDEVVVAVLVARLVIVHPVLLRRGFTRLHAARDADEPRVELLDVLLHPLDGVSLRVD